MSKRRGEKKKGPLYIVRQMLIRRSQLQPAINAAAAGGKMIATCGGKETLGSSKWIAMETTHTTMRQMSEARTVMVSVRDGGLEQVG